MDFVYVDLHQQQSGAVVEVTLKGNAANVFLVDGTNFNNYRRGMRYSCYGGHTRRSPVRLTIPRTGHWYAVANLGGYPGRLGISARVLPGAMPALRQQPMPNLSAIADNAAAFEPDEPDPAAQDGPEYDVFVSHATEDKEEIVRPLALALQERGVAVWYDEFELRIGDSLRRKIDHGLARSRFGVVVLSHAFFEKNWPQYELDGLVTREMAGDGQIILPLWHKISKDEVMSRSPSLADKVALQTAVYAVDDIAQQIAEVIAGS